jgi:hypothetical protein
MSVAKSTTSPVPGNRRLTPRQTADALGLTINKVMLVSAKGGKYFDFSFPPMHRGTFDEVEVLARKKVQEDGAKQSISLPGAPPVAANNPLPDRRTVSERRAR